MQLSDSWAKSTLFRSIKKNVIPGLSTIYLCDIVMIVPLPVAMRLFVFFLNHFGPLACVLSPPLLLLINSDSSQLF